MGNKVLETILARKIENFVSTFVEDSKSIFFDGKQLKHSGEFGRYRENSIKDLLQILTKYKISDGFIITPSDRTSTQCDIVVYDNFDFPVLENNLIQFFSIESVLSIGEVKSTLSKKEFKNALIKLAKNKKLSEDIRGKVKQKTHGDEYNHPLTFLVCKDLKFDISKIDFEDIYEDIPKVYWHNLILSVEQGLFTYEFNFQTLSKDHKTYHIANNLDVNKSIFVETPLFSCFGTIYNCTSNFRRIEDLDKFKHIKFFITAFSQAINRKTIYQTEIIYYIGYDLANLYIQ